MERSHATLSNQMLQNKLRSKKDLYDYMSSHLNIWLPKTQYCRLSFLQQIIQDKKKCLKTSEVKMQNIREGWNEFAIKNILKYIDDDTLLHEYLPWEDMKEGRFPDKQFFWGVAFTVKSNWAQQFFDLCIKERNKVNVSPFQKKTIIVSEFWQQKLAEHEYISKCKSSKKQSIVIEQEVRPYKKRDAMNKVVVELYSNQVDNIPNISEINQTNIVKPFQFDFSTSRMNKNNQENLKNSANFQFAFNENKALRENQDPNNFQQERKSLINNESLLLGNTEKQIIPNFQNKMGPTKKRRPEEFRANQGAEEEFTALKNFSLTAEKNDNEITKKSPHKSAKKHKFKEEAKE